MTSACRRILLTCLLLPLLVSATAFADGAMNETGSIGGDVFGKNGKWLHAYLTLAEAYDDNIYNTEHDTHSSWITTISPGFQIMIPGSDQKTEDIDTSTTTPGGLVFGRFSDASFRRFRAYIGYTPSFERYCSDSDENTTSHSAQAGVQYNLRSGLSLDVTSQFISCHDRQRANISTRTDRFNSLLLNATAACPITEKFLLRTDYSNFAVDYRNNGKNGFRDRTDNAFSGLFFFKIKPTASIFLKYQFIEMAYNERADHRDSDIKEYTTGVVWLMTAKTQGNLSAGYGTREYHELSFGESNRMTFQVNISYRLSPKTIATISGFHRNEESAETNFGYTRTTGGSFNYFQALTYKIAFELDLSYRRDVYKAAVDQSADTRNAAEDFFSISPALTYALNTRISASMAWEYRKNNSDFDNNTYSGKTCILKLTGSI